MRLSILLVLCAGCDTVFLDERNESALCGPYDDPTPVAFDAALPPLTHFSPVGDRALARTTDVPPRLLALRFDGATWIADAPRQSNLDELRTQQRVDYAQLASATTMFAAQRSQTDSFYRVYEYVFREDVTPNAWSLADALPVASMPNDAILPGGSLVTGAGSIDEYRYLVTAHETAEDGRFVAVEVKTMQSAWQSEASSGVLSTSAINEKQIATHGALALGRNGRPTLIYAASERASVSSSDLFVSERVSGRFQVGIALALGGDDGEEAEPATNADCSVLYFRRGDQILQARARD